MEEATHSIWYGLVSVFETFNFVYEHKFSHIRNGSSASTLLIFTTRIIKFLYWTHRNAFSNFIRRSTLRLWQSKYILCGWNWFLARRTNKGEKKWPVPSYTMKKICIKWNIVNYMTNINFHLPPSGDCLIVTVCCFDVAHPTVRCPKLLVFVYRGRRMFWLTRRFCDGENNAKIFCSFWHNNY